MHKSEIKKFAVWARNQLRQQIQQRATLFGFAPKARTLPELQSAEQVVFGEVVYGVELARGYQGMAKRFETLLARNDGKYAPTYEALIDEAAYSWFNRLSALRLMEVNGFLPRRVLSSSDGGHDPDLLRDALQIALQQELPGISTELVDELRHSDDASLYQKLLIAQCNALKGEYPFLFETISDELALLLPQNLLGSESVVRKLVAEIPESDWQEVEIIGWLYQYYISERKDAVIGAKKAVPTADIPAATQLFTPAWIVQYMVQNSLGRLWLEAHPESQLKAQMPYYLDTPEQSPEVQLKISASINAQLQPQEISLIDPACGSGHILVYAFDLLYEIYREQGYRDRDIPALILEHNLVGLDLDGRAVQMAAFALMIKARQKLRRLKGLSPRVYQVQTSRGINLSDAETLGGLSAETLKPWQSLISAFADADTLGSLLTPPDLDYTALYTELETMQASGNPYLQSLAEELEPLLQQASVLSDAYDVVVANPPYMGGKSFNPTLKSYVVKEYKRSKGDLFAVFMDKCLQMLKPQGLMGMINQHAWMFLSSYEELRQYLSQNYTVTSMLHLGARAFPEIGGEVVQSTAFVMKPQCAQEEKGNFVRLIDYKTSEAKEQALLRGDHRYQAASQDFEKIPGAPVAYWVSDRFRSVFRNLCIKDISFPRKGLVTLCDDRFIRLWHEIKKEEKLTENKKWVALLKGGPYRKWYGNHEHLINWKDNGGELKTFISERYGGASYTKEIRSEKFYFKPNITWSGISSYAPSFRLTPLNFIISSAGSSLYLKDSNPDQLIFLCGYFNSNLNEQVLKLLSPTLNILPGDIGNIPYLDIQIKGLGLDTTKLAISLSKTDWDAFETSWGFERHPMLQYADAQTSIQSSFQAWSREAESRFRELQALEVENNRYWIEAYGLQDELTPDVPDEQVTVRRADEERDIKSLLSYALGCIMGRYSLDEPGLIHAGQPFDPARHTLFPADADGIVPVHDTAWFEDDLVLQLMNWLKTVYGEAHYADNMAYLAQVLGQKGRETPEDTLRRYFLSNFMKDHHQIYKKRPIYWFFSSGKKRAFNAYVYLHRYDKDTLARLRTEYLHPLQLKLAEEAQRLQGDPAQAKRLKALNDQLDEILAYDEILKHKAEQRISLDLDDGVAYNYTLFEGLVYEGADLKMADLKNKSQWKRDLLQSQKQVSCL